MTTVTNKQANDFGANLEYDNADTCYPENVKECLEIYEQSKWVKLDGDDTSTWPRSDKPVIGKTNFGEYHTVTLRVMVAKLRNNNAGYKSEHYTHWHPMPKFKE